MTATLEQLQLDAPTLLLRVAAGEEIVVTVHGEPAARIVPLPAATSAARHAGSLRGQVWMAPDFDAPLADFRDHQ